MGKDGESLIFRVATAYYLKFPVFQLKNYEAYKERQDSAHKGKTKQSIESVHKEALTLDLLDKDFK